MKWVSAGEGGAGAGGEAAAPAGVWIRQGVTFSFSFDGEKQSDLEVGWGRSPRFGRGTGKTGHLVRDLQVPYLPLHPGYPWSLGSEGTQVWALCPLVGIRTVAIPLLKGPSRDNGVSVGPALNDLVV